MLSLVEGRSLLLEHASDFETKRWSVARAGDLDRHHGASVPPEQRVDDLQQQRFDAGGRLRDFGIHDQIPPEGQGFPAERVASVKLNHGTWHVERQVLERETSAAQVEPSAE